MTEQLVKNVNKVLYAEAPKVLIAGIEPFVAVLRNKKDANNVDVELFFKKHANLIAKMKRMDMRSMQADVVNMNLDRLEKALGPMKNSSGSQGHEDASEFTVLVEWGINFCKGAQIDVKIKQ